ncbi:MAG: peptide ABC transporter substrate-binding protein [Chloroflexi bacterium]|nr:peptide ABC transporter substrate-binding protein [Chloroflexota bacterium]
MKTKLTLLLIVVMALSSFGGMSIAQSEDTVNILFWQAASQMNPYLGTGTKEFEAAASVLEPLARYNPAGEMVPWLVDEIPTVENGGVSEDLTTITWTLSEGILWSDGSALTAHDVVFSGEFCLHPETGCTVLSQFDGVESIEALDDMTVKITFSGPKPFPYGPFVGFLTPIIQKAQFEDCIGAASLECSEENFGPIGTGPYVVEDFRVNDVVTYTANPNFREEGKPYFSRQVFKGGGDAESAARAVLETGEADYAWNLQISPAVLNAMEAAGNGTVIAGYANNVERLMVNQTNPDPMLDADTRSVWMEDNGNPHPFLHVPAIWQAMSMAIDRNTIATQLYGAGGVATCNVISGPPSVASPNNDACLVQDIDGANALLDEAGIMDSDGDGIREYMGMPLMVSYQTSTNAVRQNTQALIKQWWSEIGIETELRNISASVFFGGDVASPDTYAKFYTDIEMYTNGSNGTDMEPYLGNWRTTEIPGPWNKWGGSNVPRWYSEEFDALLDEMAATASAEGRIALTIQMNDMLVQNGVMIPLVFRASVSAHANSISGVDMNAWDSELWNIADWTRM